MLELLKLELENAGPFDQAALNYSSGITGFISPVGTGKTTIMCDALRYALAGALPPTAANKKDLLKWGAKKGRIVLTLRDGPRLYELTRSVSGSSQRLVRTWAGEEAPVAFISAADVETALTDLLGCSPEVFCDAFFVLQGSFSQIVTMKHAARASFLQSLFRMAHYEKLRTLIQERASAIELYALPRSVEELRKEIQYKQGVLTSKQQAAEQAAAAHKELHAQALERNVSEILRRPVIESAEEYAQRLDALRQSVASLQDELLQAKHAVEQVEALRRPELTRQSYKVLLTRWPEYQAAKGFLASQAPGLSEQISAVSEQISALNATKNANAARSAEMQKALEVGSVCCTCLQPVSDEHKSAIAAKLEELRAGTQAVIAELQSCQEQYAKLSNQQRAEQAANSVIVTHEHAMACAGLPENCSLEDVQAKQAEVEQALATEQAYENARTQLLTLTSQLQEAQQALNDASSAQLCTKQEHDEAQQLQDAVKQAYERMKDADSEADQVRGELKSLEEQLHRAEELARANEHKQQLRGVLAEARELLHRERLPKKVLLSYLRTLNFGIREKLSQMDVDFSAELGESLDFETTDAHGTHNAARLSGGQRVQLAFAFYLTLMDIINPKLRVLVLDEPSVHLDNESVEALVQTLSRHAGSSADMQLLISDHHPALVSILDHVITPDTL